MAWNPFEVGDVLPATTQLRIIADIPSAGWDGQGGAYTTNQYLRVYTYDDSGGADYGFDVKINGSFLTLSNYNLSKLVNNEWVSCEDVEYNIMSIIIDTSTWTETQRTIVNETHPVYWEDLNATQGYTITFNSNGGTTISDIEEATELPNPLPTPTKSGSVFVGWYYESTFTTKAQANDVLTADVTLYAKWYDLSIGKLYKGDVERSDIQKIYKGTTLLYEKEEEPSYPTNVVVFKSDSPRTITPKYTNSGVTLQYSIDKGTTWTNISSGVATTSATEHWFRGQATGTKSLFTANNDTNAWTFSGSSELKVYGNLNYLLCDTLGVEVAPTTIGDYCYTYMFYGCTSLIKAPELPATTVGNSSYRNMFRDCTSLTTAPDLPATTATNSCYDSMFYGCTSLVTPPELPATTVQDYSYANMFRGCTSLTTAPDLPATTLGSYCYQSMFRDCIALTTPPELPATTITTGCYNSMFYGCTSLTTAPDLPATAATNSCYNSMFYGCTSLVTPPELPATTVENYSYASMFYGCTSLTTAPDLPATTMKQYCYQFMFRGCTSLTIPPELPAISSSIYCYRGMFYNCTSLTKVTKLPMQNMLKYCYAEMFRGCTSIKVSTTKTGSYQYAWRIPTSGTAGYADTGWSDAMLSGTGGTFKGDPSINTTYYVENPPV